MDAIMSFALPERGAEQTPIPLARAKNRAITDGLIADPSTRAPTEMERPPGAVIELRPRAPKQLPPAVVVDAPPEQTQPVMSRARNRRLWWLSGVIAALSIGTSLALVVPPARKAAPRQSSRTAPAAVHVPAASPVRTAPVAVPAAKPVAAPAPSVIVKDTKAPAKPKKLRKHKSDSKQEPRPRWDPNSLFPE
jgi:hypothetical protein